MICTRNDIFNRSTRIRRVYEELLKQEKRSVLTLKCLSGAVAFMFVGLFLLAFLSLDVVRNIAKGFGYESGNCIVENSVITGHNVSCKCEIHSCFSRYPCLRVFVRITDRTQKRQLYKSVLLHNNIFDLGSHVSHVYVYCIKRN